MGSRCDTLHATSCSDACSTADAYVLQERKWEENEADVSALAAEVGFDVRVICPDRTTELCKIYRELNASDAMVGVHSAAMTHFLFM